ncbi:MAG: GAF domain-containing protein [Cyclobacteriaceae bacterium]|nr:GAF domain-containing protein [Cyclobacteriaceae bacterium]
MIGIVVSAFTLISADVTDFQGGITIIHSTVSVTFLLGLASLYALAANKYEKVVYIEKKNLKVDVSHKTELQELSQLQLDVIGKKADNPNNTIQNILNEVCDQLQAGQGALYLVDKGQLELKYGYALSLNETSSNTFEFGEGLIGRVATEGKTLYIDKLPKGYMNIFSGLGSASPSFLVIVPIIKDTTILGVMEISTFHPINKLTIEQLYGVAEMLYNEINTRK